MCQHRNRNAVNIHEVPAKLESMLAIIDAAREGLDTLVKSGVAVDRSLIDSISKLASAHANLSRESLRWVERLKKQATQASLEEHKNGVLVFITNLPLGERMQLYEAMVAFEGLSSPGIPLRLT